MKQMSNINPVHEAILLLERTPDTVSALLSGVSDHWLRCTEGSGTWSPYDVIGHLIHGERTDWIPRVRHILSGETRPFEPFDREAQLRDSADEPIAELLETFAKLRTENVNALVSMKLTEGDLERTGQHPALGTVTLRQLIATWVVHDLDHIAQIARTMAKVYSQEVGPWKEYLSILKERQKGSDQ